MANGARTIKPDEMQHDYYNINPPRHAEAAYQPRQGDRYPPLSTVPTTAGSTGEVVVLVTTLYNKNIRGSARMQLIDYRSLVRFAGGVFPTPDKAEQILREHPEIIAGSPEGQVPFLAVINCEANSTVTVRPLNGGYQAKAINIDDYRNGQGRPPL